MKTNPFKEISSKKDVPPEIKKKVMSETASILLAMELADLFTVKSVSILEDFFTSKKKKK